MSADLIAQWRVVAQQVDQVETQLVSLREELAAAKLRRDVIDRSLQEMETTTPEAVSDLKAKIARLTDENETLRQASSATEDWCRQRSGRNKEHLETLRERVADVRTREEAADKPLPLSSHTLHLQRESREMMEEIEQLQGVITRRRHQLGLHQEVKELEQVCQDAAKQCESARQEYHVVVRSLEASDIQLQEAKKLSTSLETLQHTVHAEMKVATPIVRNAFDIVCSLNLPLFPEDAVSKLQSMVDRFCEIEAQGMPPSSRRRIVRGAQ